MTLDGHLPSQCFYADQIDMILLYQLTYVQAADVAADSGMQAYEPRASAGARHYKLAEVCGHPKVWMGKCTGAFTSSWRQARLPTCLRH